MLDFLNTDKCYILSYYIAMDFIGNYRLVLGYVLYMNLKNCSVFFSFN